jgi:hypothetical protein
MKSLPHYAFILYMLASPLVAFLPVEQSNLFTSVVFESRQLTVFGSVPQAQRYIVAFTAEGGTKLTGYSSQFTCSNYGAGSVVCESITLDGPYSIGVSIGDCRKSTKVSAHLYVEIGGIEGGSYQRVETYATPCDK